MLPITKEKVLFAVAALVALFVLLNLRAPQSEPPPEVPPPQAARAFRVVGGAPLLAPEKTFSAERDPFQVQDAWGEARPALLAVPPTGAWPRALPGGPAPVPDSPHDRLLVEEPPRPPQRQGG